MMTTTNTIQVFPSPQSRRDCPAYVILAGHASYEPVEIRTQCNALLVEVLRTAPRPPKLEGIDVPEFITKLGWRSKAIADEIGRPAETKEIVQLKTLFEDFFQRDFPDPRIRDAGLHYAAIIIALYRAEMPAEPEEIEVQIDDLT